MENITIFNINGDTKCDLFQFNKVLFQIPHFFFDVQIANMEPMLFVFPNLFPQLYPSGRSYLTYELESRRGRSGRRTKAEQGNRHKHLGGKTRVLWRQDAFVSGMFLGKSGTVK